MSFLLQPWHILLATICGLGNQRHQQIIEFQNARIEALLKKHEKKRLLLDDDQRRLLAVKGRAIGRKALLIVKELSSRRSFLTLRVADTTTPASAVRRTATGTRLTTGTTTWAFVCSAVPSSKSPEAETGQRAKSVTQARRAQAEPARRCRSAGRSERLGVLRLPHPEPARVWTSASARTVPRGWRK